ncbi:hypothetical protein BC937DRAFT_87818 [Endogone sp. FLAS-F59071]|nr:hypothetical protein BC937DRAFT_87818 [Endogone sp. FLAS-F59071]|eukprot:RUS19218.1 hypothetical protein BC937DRAFT_87818 [Endogone sp. FLAS-F59071]
MFNNNAPDKKSFIDKAKADRLRREQERQQQRDQKEFEDAVRRIQRAWRAGSRRRRCIRERWLEWDAAAGYEVVGGTAEGKVTPQPQKMVTLDLHRIVGLFYLFSPEAKQGNLEEPAVVNRFTHLCKLLLAKTTRNDGPNELATIPYHALLVDARYSDNAIKYLKLMLTTCWRRVCGYESSSTSTTVPSAFREVPALYLAGSELRVLLQYLNMKNYVLTAPQIFDTTQLLSDHVKLLRKRAEDVRKDVTSRGMYAMVGHGMALRVNRIVKLRSAAEKHQGGQMTSEEVKFSQSITLWITAVLRCVLLVVEAEAETGAAQAVCVEGPNNGSTFDQFVLHVLSIPLLCEYLDAVCLGMLKTAHVFDRTVARIRVADPVAQSLLKTLEGNGCLFLLGNLVGLWPLQTGSSSSLLPVGNKVSSTLSSVTSNAPSTALQSPSIIDTIPPTTQSDFIQAATRLLVECQFYKSEKHTLTHQQYHALFKWYSGKKFDVELIPVTHFDRLIRQIEHLWSRRFIDTAFAGVLELKNEPTSSHSPPTHSLQSLSLKKHTKSNATNKTTSASYTILAIDIQNACRLYTMLMQTFPKHRGDIMSRLAYAPGLIPQLWRFMNLLGPKGGMHIYLEAAKRKGGDVESEPLIEILKVFCEACGELFPTLDDEEVYEKQSPFKLEELVALSSFLNQFYLFLLQKSIFPITDTTSSNLRQPKFKSFDAARSLLLQLYDRDTRRPFCPPNHWLLISDPRRPFPLPNILAGMSSQPSQFLTSVREADPVALNILSSVPHTVPFATRLDVFRDYVAAARAAAPVNDRGVVIRVRRQYVMEDGFRQLGRLNPTQIRGLIRVKFVNELGGWNLWLVLRMEKMCAEEIGIDQGGPFKEFISQLTLLAFSPAFNLFSATSITHLLYPSLTSITHANHLELFEFVGRVLGKAVYEGVLVEAQFAPFFVAKLLGRHVFLEDLAGLDEELWRNLLFVKRYDGDVEDLGLTFATDEDVFAHAETEIWTMWRMTFGCQFSTYLFSLPQNGRHIPVKNENRIEYVYSMAHYRLNQQSKDQSKAFINGFKSIINENWLKLFSPPELQRVISGEDVDFDVADLRKHTQYQNGYFDQHPVVRALWQVLEDLDSDDKRAFLKFVTSCSKPPLGGFEFLQPPFTIRLVPMSGDDPSGDSDSPIRVVKALFGVGAGEAAKGRLPSSSTWYVVVNSCENKLITYLTGNDLFFDIRANSNAMCLIWQL